jgi:hypothetical protein
METSYYIPYENKLPPYSDEGGRDEAFSEHLLFFIFYLPENLYPICLHVLLLYAPTDIVCDKELNISGLMAQCQESTYNYTSPKTVHANHL